MYKYPATISSLEEDLREIGLAPEKAELSEEAAPAEPAPAAAVPATPAPTATLDEKRVLRQVRVVGGKATRVKTKRTSMAKKLANRGYYRKKKNVIARRRGKAVTQRRAARRDKIRSRIKHEGFDGHVATLMESVKDLLTQVRDGETEVKKAPEMAEAVKTFANLAIISEMLADAFMAFAEDADSFELSKFEIVALQEMAATYAQVAEDCAEIAETLDKGTLAEEDKEGVEEAFKAHMQTVLDGIEAFADLTEDDDNEEGDDEDMCDDCEEPKDECSCGDSGKK